MKREDHSASADSDCRKGFIELKDSRRDNEPFRHLRIALCTPQFERLQQAAGGRQPTDAPYILQAYIGAGLQAAGHRVTFTGSQNLSRTVCTTDLDQPAFAPQTWSAARWFELAGKGCWRLQRWLGIPYLNVFSNYSRLDACLQCLPQHDVVYEWNSTYRMAVAMACKRLGLPYVLHFDADEILEHDIMGRPITGLLRWRARETARYNLGAARCVICVSSQSRNHLVVKWKVPEEKIVVFPNAADVERFRPDPQARSEIRASFAMESNPLVIFVGNFYEWHDVATLLNSFAGVLQTSPESRLVLVGDGQTKKAMEQLAADLGIGPAVRFTGRVGHGEVPRLVAAADIAVAPYPVMPHDLWLSPLKLFEYMASGTAIVASAVGQVKEVIQDDINGLQVSPGDASALAAALKKLIGDPALRAELGLQARRDAVQRYSWQSYVARLQRLFFAIVEGEPLRRI